MRKNYDFSKAEKNPYAKKLKGKKIVVQPDVSFTLKDIFKANPQKKIESDLRKTIASLEKRVARLELKLKR